MRDVERRNGSILATMEKMASLQGLEREVEPEKCTVRFSQANMEGAAFYFTLVKSSAKIRGDAWKVLMVQNTHKHAHAHTHTHTYTHAERLNQHIFSVQFSFDVKDKL